MTKHWIAQATAYLNASRDLAHEVTVQDCGIVSMINKSSSDYPNSNSMFLELNRVSLATIVKAAFCSTTLPDTPTMPFCEAHFCGFFMPRSPLDMSFWGIAKMDGFGIIAPNNTPQAYLSEHRHDAQTGGLLISGVGYAI